MLNKLSHRILCNSLLLSTINFGLADPALSNEYIESDKYPEGEWTTIISNDYEVIKIKNGSITGNSNSKSGSFATFSTENNQTKVLESTGRLNLECDGKPYNSWNTKSINFTYYQDYQASPTSQNSYNIYYILMHKLYPIKHYICDDINPNYLKVGMAMKDVRKLLNSDGFEIFNRDAEDDENFTTGPICDDDKKCELHGNNAVTRIYFQNRQTGATIVTGSVNYELYTASFSEF
ncbi:hypothetical protein [Synechocystis salina]|uniref:Uncharacterized protein n=1 Tax=Synechocystis salina LEGE 00031 TaxID=1828736 RepID=A0ABR9VPZ1_9SYNC|nr:hypothetical protein [Synechocystis salina]MBE9240251.1 hypothetical protein [Synechocystis salina LEGE 00041]MBE9253382.1 hypothetical protein [Synechocystis salina LEGE 00031]